MLRELPRYAVPIVGRSRAIADVAELLRESRVVTIAGAGGIGKTRVAVEFSVASLGGASELWFVELGSIDEGDLVPAAIAAAGGLEPPVNSDPIEALVGALRSRNVLIVLDNCEHVTAACAAIADVLVKNAPNVRILATSRESLGIDGESVYRLETLDDVAATELFTTHAQLADPGFEVTPQNSAVVREICKRLDGIALAIQLAAACVRTTPLGQLRSRLDGRFRLLVADAHGTLPRHKTMQALIDWSYDLLDERERTLFRRIGVFTGAFDLGAVVHVAGDSERDHRIYAELLTALVDKSILLQVGDQRYRMLESMRQYALARVADAGEEPGLRRAHAEYFESRSARAAQTFGSGTEEAWVAEFSPDLENFRAAIDWARRSNVQLAANIVANLADFWEAASLVGEGLRRSEAMLAAIESPGSAEALPLLIAVAHVALPAHVYRRSLELSQQAVTIAQRAGDAAAEAEARRIAGRSRYLLSIQPALSERELFDALTYFRERGTPFEVARATRDYASALALRDPVGGHQLLLEALMMAQAVEWPSLALHVAVNVAEREFRSGNATAAVKRARRVIEDMRGRRSAHQLGHALTNLTSYLAFTGAHDEALETAREASTIGLEQDAENYIAISLQAVALGFAERGETRTAARLLGYVEEFYTRFGMEPEPTEALVQKRLNESLRRHLDEASVEREMAAGAGLSKEAVSDLAFRGR